MPDWEPVSSNHLEAVRYDETRRSLTIRFRDSREYEYEEVPVELYQDLLRAPSPSFFFRSRIKAQFRTNRLA